MVDGHSTLSEHLLDVAVIKPMMQKPARRHRDHIGREPETQRRQNDQLTGGNQTRTSRQSAPTEKPASQCNSAPGAEVKRSLKLWPPFDEMRF